MTKEIVDRYVAVWNEPSADARRTAIRTLWTEDGSQVLHPPKEIREEARRVGFPGTLLEARGYEQLETRVTTAYEEFVRPGEFAFQSANDAVRLRDVVKFRWQMVRRSDGEIVGGGLDFFVLADDDRIRTDYQFPD